MQRFQRGAGLIARSLMAGQPLSPSPAQVREMVLDAALNAVVAANGHRALNALEIGTMFAEKEGRSTLRIARALTGGTFVSVDLESQAIAKCKTILAKHDPALVNRATFVEGASPDIIPETLDRTGPLNFALIDGVAEPEPNLREFELILPRLTDHGLLLIDDAQDVPPGPQYGGPRAFGKASPIIVPWLVLAEHWRYRYEYLRDSQPPKLLTQLACLPLIRTLAPYDWHLIGVRCHRMLALARPAMMAELMKRIPETLQVDPGHPRPR